jgi:hypothetical protein
VFREHLDDCFSEVIATGSIRHGHAIVVHHHPDCAWVHGLADCDCVTDVNWYADWSSDVTADTAGAAPVTVLEP